MFSRLPYLRRSDVPDQPHQDHHPYGKKRKSDHERNPDTRIDEDSAKERRTGRGTSIRSNAADETFKGDETAALAERSRSTSWQKPTTRPPQTIKTKAIRPDRRT